MLCLGLFWSVEVAIADVHDGDAGIAQVEAGAADAASRPYGESSGDALTAVPHPPAPDGQPPGEPHSVHVDHCAHGHAAPIVSSEPEQAPPPMHDVVSAASHRAPASLASAPPVPPPVA